MQLQNIAEQAQRDPARVCNNGFHVIDQEFLLEAYHQTQTRRAPGMDHVTAQQYAECLDEPLRDLHARLRDKRYVAPPVERVWLEKDGGETRPIGKPCFEAKIVQRAVVMILEAIFEQDFPAFSHGFRKGHSPHQALHERRAQCRTLHANWRVDAEVSGCFDNLDWSHLRAFLQQRVNEGSTLRLSGKWLHAGVLEAGALMHPDKGPPQGGGLSPRLAHIFLPHVLDEWCVKDVQPRMQGQCFLARFADDCIIGCALEADARRGREVLPKRCARFRLTMHPEKTGVMAFKRPPSRNQSAGGTGIIRRCWMYPLLGHNTPGRLGHQAQDDRETPPAVYERELDRVS